MLGYSFVPIIAGYIRGRISYRLERSFARIAMISLYPILEKLIVVILLGLFDYIYILEEVRVPEAISRW